MKLKVFIPFMLLLVLVTAIFTIPSFAAEEKADSDSTWNIYFRPGVRFGTESRVLYILDFLIPLYQDEKNIFFSNIKYTPNDRDGWELNVGAGYRRLLWEEKLLLGLNAYYDKRLTDWGTNHEQWGVGLEAMVDIPLESFDLGLTGRFNYYYPLSHTKIDGLGTPYASYILSDSGIILYGGRVEEPMRGFDYEAGVRIPYISDYVETWAYAGGYHYKGRRVRDINGFAARLEVIPTDFMRLNYEFHHDNYSKAEHYGEVTLEVPFSIGNLVTGKNPFEGIDDVFTGSRDLKERMVEPTRRDVDVKVIVDTENDNIPGGGEEIEDVVFVSETGSDATGDGTIKNPYREVGYAMNNDPRILSGACRTIHVMNSDPTSPAGGGVVNREGMLIWGSGVNHPDYPVSNMPYSGYPTVRPPLGTDFVLTLARPNITVTGLEINKTGGTPGGGGIRINNVGSGVKITENIFNIDRLGDVSGIYSGIAGPMGTETNPIVIANNTFSVNSTASNASGIYLETTNDIFAKIIGNEMSNTITGLTGALGIMLFSLGGDIGSDTSPAIIYGNPMTVTASDGEAFGIALNADSDIFAAIVGNDMSNTITGRFSANGIYIYSNTGIIGSETMPLIISGNPMTVTSNIGDAYGISLSAEGDIFAAIVGNDMSNTIWANSSADGIYLYSNSGNIGSETTPLIISENPMTLTANNGDAYGISLDADDDIFATIVGNDMSNTITAAGFADGIWLYSDGGNIGSATSPVIISGNPMTVTANNGFAWGIYLAAFNDIFTTIVGNDMSNTITAPGPAEGIYLYSDGGNIGSAIRPVIISGNPMTVTSTSSDAYGISLDAFNDIFATIVGNDMSNTITAPGPAEGIYLYSGSGNIGSATSPVIISGNPMTVTSNLSVAFGINFDALNDIFATIVGNDMSNTISGNDFAVGIYLYSDEGNIGSETRPIIVSGNPMTVTAAGVEAAGILVETYGTDKDVFATITGNDMSNTILGNMFALGISLYADDGDIGSETRPVIISGNPMTVVGSTVAGGIALGAEYNIFTSITGNDMSNTITAGSSARGIYLQSFSGYIGSETNPITIAGNPITVISSDEAVGIGIEGDLDVFGIIKKNIMDVNGVNLTGGIGIASYSGSIGSALSPLIVYSNSITASSINDDVGAVALDASANVFTTIKRNYMNLTSTIADAAGAYIVAGGLIGDVTSLATIFYDNYGRIIGGNNDFYLYITTGSPGGGNYVYWGGNYFTTIGGWDGDYGPNNEVYLGFPWVTPDVIYP